MEENWWQSLTVFIFVLNNISLALDFCWMNTCSMIWNVGATSEIKLAVVGSSVQKVKGEKSMAQSEKHVYDIADIFIHRLLYMDKTKKCLL